MKSTAVNAALEHDSADPPLHALGMNGNGFVVSQDPPAGAPPLRHVFSLMTYSSVSLMSPFLRALNTSSTVISFIMLDGARSSSAFFSNSTLPLLA